MLKQKSKTPTSISRGLLLVVSLAVLAVGLSPFIAKQKTALAATNGTINFQARLLTAAGSIVPDGQYNVEFKLYNVNAAGTALWTETRTGTDKVTVKNGYLTVNLGSVTAFGNGINWDQELWLGMNIGGTGSPAWDGEMTPRLKLTSVPYSFRSGAVVSADGTSVLIAANGESGNICVQNSANCGFVQGTATGFIQNTTTPQTANISITSSLGASSAMTIQGASSASVPVAVIRGGATPGSAADVLQLQDSSNAVLFKVDNDGDAELARSLKINYASGVTNQLNIQGPSGLFVAVNSANNKFHIGDTADCTSGRFCVAQTISGTGGASYTNAFNNSAFNLTQASTIIGQDIKISDTSSSVSNLIRGLRVDASGTTNTAATLNSFQIFIPTTSSASTYGGNAIQVQQANNTNIFKITNTGQATFQSTNNTASAFQILNSGGGAMFTLNTNGTNNGIYVGGTTGNEGGRIFFGSTSDTGVWIGESGTTDTNILALNGNSGLNLLVNNTTVGSFSSTGALTLQNSSNSSNAVQVKNAAGTQLLNVDSTPDSSNLVTNGSFEQNTSGWSGRSATLSQTTSQAYAGTGALQIATTATTDAGAKQNVSLVAGQQYTLSFMARSAAAFTSFAFGYSADGSTEATHVTNVSTMAVLSWTRYSITFTPSAVSGTPYIFFKQTTGTARTFYIDAVQLDQAGNPYAESHFAINGSVVSPAVFQNASDSTNAFGVYNAAGSSILSVDTRNSRVGIGAAAPQARLHVVATTGTAMLVNHTGASGNILELQKSGNAVVSVSNSGAMLLQPSTDANNVFQVKNNGGTVNALTVDTTGGTAVTVGGLLNVAGDSANDALTVSNSTSTGNIAIFKDGTTAVATIADGGAVTFQNSANSNSAFRILNAAGTTALFTANTSSADTGVYISGTGTGGGGSRVFFGPTGDTGVWIGEEGTTSTNVLALNGNSGIKLMTNGTAVGTVSSDGAFAFQNSTDSNFAFTIKSQLNAGIMRVDSINRKIAIGNYSGTAADNIGAQLEILPVHDSRAALSIKGYSPTYVARYIDVKNSDGNDIFTVTSNGDITTASGVIGTLLQNGAASNSMSLISGNVTGSNVSANSGVVTIRSGNNTAGATGALTLMSGNATGTGAEANTGSVTIDSGSVAAGGSGTAGNIFIGTNNAPAITIGNAAKTQTVNIGASFTTDANSTVRIATSTAASRVQTVIIGSTSSTSSTTINSGTAGTTFKGTSSSTAFRILNSSASDVPLFAVDSSSSRVYIGNPTSDSTGALLVLDTKTGASDPTGVAGGMYYNSTLQKMRCYEGDGYWVDCRQSARSSFFYTNDYVGALLVNNSQGEMMQQSISVGSGTFAIDPGEAGHPGLLQHGATSINSYSVMKARGNAPILLGGGDTWRFETMARFNNPSDNNQTFTFKAGFIDSSDATEVANGCFIRYTNGTNGGRWQGVCRANNTETTCDVGGSAITSSLWYRLEVIVNSSGTSADFKATANGTTTTCPISSFGPVSGGTSFGTALIKTNGASGRNVHVDYIEVNGQLGAAR